MSYPERIPTVDLMTTLILTTKTNLNSAGMIPNVLRARSVMNMDGVGAHQTHVVKGWNVRSDLAVFAQITKPVVHWFARIVDVPAQPINNVGRINFVAVTVPAFQPKTRQLFIMKAFPGMWSITNVHVILRKLSLSLANQQILETPRP